MILRLFLCLFFGVFLVGCTRSGTSTHVTGPEIFKRHCAGCHGEDGKGILARVDMTTGEWQKSRSDEEIAVIIRNGTQGKDGTPMPPFQSVLKEIEIQRIIKDVIRQFENINSKRG